MAGASAGLAPTLHGTARHQMGKDGGFLPLAWRQRQRQKLSGTCGTEVDFGAEAASAPPERFGLGIPLFAPAACWWARPLGLSRTCTSRSS